jgi:hypothetical protein
MMQQIGVEEAIVMLQPAQEPEQTEKLDKIAMTSPSPSDTPTASEVSTSRVQQDTLDAKGTFMCDRPGCEGENFSRKHQWQ